MPEFQRLVAGYRRFHVEGWAEKRERWARLSEGQSPSLLVIACSDSRVDPAQIFDVDPGEIFVVRNVAALVPPYETTPGQHGVSAALEFAVQFLGVRHVVVLGHAMCGGCRVALDRSLHGAPPGEGGFVAQWIAMLDDARAPIAREFGTEGRPAEQAMEQAAVGVSLANLRSFPYVREKEAAGALKLHGSYFSISDGKLLVLDEATGVFQETS